MIDLTKGSRINLSKEAPGTTRFSLGLGWDVRITDGAEFDLDASALLLDANDKPVGGTSSLVFYGQQVSPCGGVASSGDNCRAASAKTGSKCPPHATLCWQPSRFCYRTAPRSHGKG